MHVRSADERSRQDSLCPVRRGVCRRPTLPRQGRKCICRACGDALIARGSARNTTPSIDNIDPDATVAIEASQVIDDAPPATDDGEGPIPIEAFEPEASKSCPVCKRTMAVDLNRCPHCGFDPSEGVASSSLVEKSHGTGGPALRCGNCGYDLAGIRDMRCPECGTPVPLRSPNKALSSGQSAFGRDYAEALALLAIGAAGVLVLRALQDDVAGAVATVALIPVVTLIGLAIYQVCCVAWIGMGAAWYINAVRLAGVFGMTFFASMLFGLIPLFYIPLIPDGARPRRPAGPPARDRHAGRGVLRDHQRRAADRWLPRPGLLRAVVMAG
jgi:hypothetical protein